MHLPTLRQLHYFLAIAETLSVSRAAENCHITQSTLSSALAELEDMLGVKLFDRGTRKFSLTQVGEDMLLPARAILEQTENLVRLAQQQRAPLSSKLVLGIIPTIAPYLLPKLLPALQTTYPALDLVLREDITNRQLDELKRGTIDVVLMAFPYKTQNTEDMILWSEPFFIARAGTKPALEGMMTIGDLQKEKILLLDDGHCLRDHIISACRLTSSSKTSKTLGATSLQTLIQMVQHGYGATLLPAMAINPQQPMEGISIQRFVSPQPTRQIGLAWRKNDPRAAEFRLLGKFIKETGYSF